MLVCGPFLLYLKVETPPVKSRNDKERRVRRSRKMDKKSVERAKIPKVTGTSQKDWIKQPEEERKYPKLLQKQRKVMKK